MVYSLFFRSYGVYPFTLFSQESGRHHSFFCSVTSGSGDRPRKEGSHGGGVYSLSPEKVLRIIGPALSRISSILTLARPVLLPRKVMSKDQPQKILRALLL